MSDLANSRRNLILIGFMGTGKSTVGKKVAESLEFEFIDTDTVIVQQEGKPITQIFEESGEKDFRQIETQVLKAVCEGEKRVIATGGGIAVQPENHDILRAGGYVIWLKSSPEIIYERVKRSRDRPLLNTPAPEKTIRDLLLQRELNYQNCAKLTIVTDELSLEETIYGVTETARFCL